MWILGYFFSIVITSSKPEQFRNWVCMIPTGIMGIVLADPPTSWLMCSFLFPIEYFTHSRATPIGMVATTVAMT